MSLSKEIGSEFWDVPQIEDPFSLSTKFLLDKALRSELCQVSFYESGRSALAAVLGDAVERKQISSIAMPAYCCESMLQPLESIGIEASYYLVSGVKGEGISADYGSINADAILLVDYFGLHQAPSSSYFGDDTVVIRDITHSLFSGAEDLTADYYFGSARKWAGFYTGGIAWARGHALPSYGSSSSCNYASLRQAAMAHKAQYVSGQRSDKGFLEEFCKAECMLEKRSISGGNEHDIERMERFDFNYVHDRRVNNAKVLLEGLGEHALFREIPEGETPLFFPIIVKPEDRLNLRSFLIDQKIYCPIHWPVPSKTAESLASTLYEQELSLICDQRYSQEDMLRIVDTVRAFWRR